MLHLVNFEKDVRAGKANVRVVRRGGTSGGGGAFGALDVLVLALLVVAALRRIRPAGAFSRQAPGNGCALSYNP